MRRILAGEGERRRVVVLGGVLVLLALGGVGNAVVKHRQSQHLTEANASAAASVVAANASSSAWYCPGALPIGGRPETSSIAVANVGHESVGGELVVTDSAGATTRRAFSIGKRAQAVIGLPRGGARRFAAVTVLAQGSGVAVEQMVHGSFGAVSSPCVSRVASEEYLPAGSTRGANNLTLAIYDPGATPAVASVSFATRTGSVSPPAFQGIPIGPGQVVVLDVGHYLPSRPVVATRVEASGGRIVAGTLSAATVGPSLTYSLMTGLDRPASKWYLPAVPSGASSHQTLWLYDPGSDPARVAVHLDGAGGLSDYSFEVAPGCLTAFTPAAAPGNGVLRWASVETSARTPVVVARTTMVTGPTGGSTAKGGANLVAELPLLAHGLGLTAPVPTPTTRWVLPGGEVDGRTDELVTVANPGGRAVGLRLDALGEPNGAGQPAFPSGRRFVVPAHGSLTIDAGRIVPIHRALALVVEADDPVVVGELLYARGSSGSLGLSAPAGIPVG